MGCREMRHPCFDRRYGMEFVINGYVWQVLLVPYDDYMLYNNNRYAYGVTDFNTLCIYIADDLPTDIIDDILCHELCHAFNMSYGIVMPERTEERLCNYIADYGRDIIGLLDDLLYSILQ